MPFYYVRKEMGVALNDILRGVCSNNKDYLKEDIAITWINYKSETNIVQRGFGFGINNRKLIYPASIVKLVYALATYHWIQKGRILFTREISDAVYRMLFNSSNNATSFIVDLLTGTTSGPCLEGKSWENWKFQRLIINDWLKDLNWEELYGVNCCQKTGYDVDLQSETPGEEAGIKSVTYKISGHNSYGWLKSESGVHRLVRISPFDSSAKRHTSFCSIWVYPVVDDNIDIEVNPADIRIDTFRSSGAGGQHVNTTDSAVRITHNPTGIVVTSSEKSQHQNRDIAMKALKSRLYQLELDRRSAAVVEAHENKGDAGWGNQIRSYVLQPYQMVKDLRTGHETSDTKGVLDGDLDDFMAATLAMNVSGKSRAEAKDSD